MPTPPLPVLHALLDVLGVPIRPASLRSVTPTLLLLVLESLLGQRLALTPELRRPASRREERALAQVVLGVIADDVLALDLGAVDPERVCSGATPDIAVVIMALAVIARRRGLPLCLPEEAEDEDEDEAQDADSSLLLEDEDSVRALAAPPLQPSSAELYATPPRATAASRRYKDEYAAFDPLYGGGGAQSPPAPYAPPSPDTSVASSTRASFRARRRTVLEGMIEEFGIDPV
ncbi:hypothetical protein Q8F55_007626 [Vanrija albida]|uniref:DUF5745 domain-containing protein n=1 Tax=Vanrija albida TaxID=181172 RepID=A0ABR3PU22_9TREE